AAVQIDQNRFLADEGARFYVDGGARHMDVIPAIIDDPHLALEPDLVLVAVIDAGLGGDLRGRGVIHADFGIDSNEFHDAWLQNILNAGDAGHLEQLTVRTAARHFWGSHGDARALQAHMPDGNIGREPLERVKKRDDPDKSNRQGRADD